VPDSPADLRTAHPGVEEGPRLVVLISGSGRTLANLADRIADGSLPARITGVVSNRRAVAGIERARERGLPVRIVRRMDLPDEAAFGAAIWRAIEDFGADLVCLAGWLVRLPIPDAWRGRILNIHPALLPDFGGRGMYGDRVHAAVLASGRPESGCTVHFVDDEYDRGPIILRRRCPVAPDDDVSSLAARVFAEECRAYPEAIRRVWSGAVRYDSAPASPHDPGPDAGSDSLPDRARDA